MNLYANKEPIYFSDVRADLISLLPRNTSNRVLEIGCGGGSTLVKIKELGLAREVAGIELFDMPGTNQNHPNIDSFQLGNIETMDIPFPEGYFDVIICGDVLEHLVDPWSVVRKISLHLRPGGTLLVSIPNFREITTFYKIFVRGDFRYADSGILDKTHLRFFCRQNVKALLTTDLLQPLSIHPSYRYNPNQRKRKVLNGLTLGLFRDLLTIQFIAVVQKKAVS